MCKKGSRGSTAQTIGIVEEFIVFITAITSVPIRLCLSLPTQPLAHIINRFLNLSDLIGQSQASHALNFAASAFFAAAFLAALAVNDRYKSLCVNCIDTRASRERGACNM